MRLCVMAGRGYDPHTFHTNMSWAQQPSTHPSIHALSGSHLNVFIMQANQLGGTGLGSTVHIYQGDVCQFSSLPPALKGSKVLFIATGFRPGPNPLGPFQIDYNGTVNLLAAAQQAKVEHVVLISSIGADDILYPLNLLFGVLFWKKRAEEAIQRSGLRYTIVRPGGSFRCGLLGACAVPGCCCLVCEAPLNWHAAA